MASCCMLSYVSTIYILYTFLYKQSVYKHELGLDLQIVKLRAQTCHHKQIKYLYIKTLQLHYITTYYTANNVNQYIV